MTELVTIRDAVPADARWVSELIGELGYDFDASSVVDRIETINSDPRSRAVVAQLAGGLVGMVSVEVSGLYEETGNVARITSLIVTKGARSNGIGKQLVSEVEEFAAKNRCSKIEVTDSVFRTKGAAAFYESLGYDISRPRFEKRLAA